MAVVMTGSRKFTLVLCKSLEWSASSYHSAESPPVAIPPGPRIVGIMIYHWASAVVC